IALVGFGEAGVDLETWVQIENGRLSLLRRPPVSPNLTIRVPTNVLRHIILTNASWDEAHVGFWCQFSRTPDVFSAGLWRLLQAPYYARPSEAWGPPPEPLGIAASTSIARVIEQYGEQAERILGRYGLYCGGCAHAPSESL